MPSNIRYLKYVFLGLLAVGCVLVTGYDLLYGVPMKKCNESHGWWSWPARKCYTPIYLPNLTHRKPGQPADVEWHDKNVVQPAGQPAAASK